MLTQNFQNLCRRWPVIRVHAPASLQKRLQPIRIVIIKCWRESLCSNFDGGLQQLFSNVRQYFGDDFSDCDSTTSTKSVLEWQKANIPRKFSSNECNAQTPNIRLEAVLALVGQRLRSHPLNRPNSAVRSTFFLKLIHNATQTEIRNFGCQVVRKQNISCSKL